MTEPTQVLDIARKAGGKILRWREEDGMYVVLLTDGRKIKEAVAKPNLKPVLVGRSKSKDTDAG
jgi:hypothetical protein